MVLHLARQNVHPLYVSLLAFKRFSGNSEVKNSFKSNPAAAELLCNTQ